MEIGTFRWLVNMLKYVNLLTPAGMRKRVRLIRAYFARKEAEYDALKAEMEELKGKTRGTCNERKSA